MGKGENLIRKTVASNIRLAREKANLTQHELAVRVGKSVTAQQISRWERDETTPGYNYIEALAAAFGLTYTFFFTANDEAE